VLVVLAAMSTRRRARISKIEDRIGKLAVPALQDADRANSIERISFQSEDGTVTVARVDGAWVAPDKYNYPLDFEKAGGFVRKLAELKIGQIVPPGEKEREALELTGDDGTLLEMTDGAGNVVAAVRFGKEHESRPSGAGQYGGYPDGRYIGVGEDAYLVSETFMDLPGDARDWLDKEIVNHAAADIAEATVTDSEGRTLTFKRPEGGGDLALTDLADDEKMTGYKANDLANMFSYLNLNDVADPAAGDEALGLSTGLVVVAKSKKGQVFTATLGNSPADSADRYIRIGVAYEAPAEPAVEIPEDEDEDAKKKREEAAAKRREAQAKLAAETKELNDRISKWVYVVSSYKVDDVKTDRSHFVEKKEEKKDEEAAGGEEEKGADAAPAEEPEPEGEATEGGEDE
jgi:hypothetical protein